MPDTSYREQRLKMVDKQLQKRGIKTKSILEAFRTVPREKFVPPDKRGAAYRDGPLSIGEGQTISQPYIVALMVEAMNPKPEDKVLEIGSGSGYAVAILAQLVEEVRGLDKHPSLVKTAETTLEELEYDNVELKVGDGTKGWPEAAPYDGILVSAAAPEIPEPLIEQLDFGGYLVLPIGNKIHQELYQVQKNRNGEITKQDLGGVRFVPLVGEYGW